MDEPDIDCPYCDCPWRNGRCACLTIERTRRIEFQRVKEMAAQFAEHAPRYVDRSEPLLIHWPEFIASLIRDMEYSESLE